MRTLSVGERVILHEDSPLDEDASMAENSEDIQLNSDTENNELERDAPLEDDDSEPEPETPHIFDEEALYDQRPTYLIGAVTRSGRAIRMKNKFTDIF